MEKLIAVFMMFAIIFIGTIVAQQENKPVRVYIEETESWEVESDPIFSSTDKKGRITINGGGTKGGAKPRTAETIKRFNQQCKGVIVTIHKDKADFIVLLEHEGGKDLFNKNDPILLSYSKSSLKTKIE
jgi:biopolymer transport protein ExbD